MQSWVLVWFGCSGAAHPPVPVQDAPPAAEAGYQVPVESGPATPPPGADPAAASATGQARTETFSGTLTYVEIRSDVKSLEAYLNESFRLELPDGTTRVLRPTSEVSAKDLQQLAGHAVEVTATYSDGHAPSAGASAPLDLEGRPMKQGGGWKVSRISKK